MLRLIHTTDLTFEEFEKLSAPSYAIVSHRWGQDEVSYQDFLDGRKREGYGWMKIVKACEIARAQDLTWLWIDTCCIDKKSSAELTESINSMYRWYYHCHDCLTLLPDVELTDADPGFSDQFRQSSWFTRGWTLQELLAPRRLLFFNKHFQHVGDKYHRLQDIVAATGIDKYYLLGMSNVREASVAERMKWASLRESTRTEDEAYCLLGLFDVNMPLLYGEGSKAFLRLQLEIIRKTDDESIFTWWQDPAQSGSWSGLLAPSPRAFAMPNNENVKVLKVQSRHPYSMTHKGLRLKTSVPQSLEVPLRSSVTILLPLNCERVSRSTDHKTTRQQIALRINVKATGQSDMPIYEGSQFRARTRSEKIILADGQVFDKSSAYSCFYTIGMRNKDTPMQPLTIYFKQDGV